MLKMTERRWKYRKYVCTITLDGPEDDGTVKAFHSVRCTETGEEWKADITPYDTDKATLELWIDCGMPPRIGTGPLNIEQLLAIQIYDECYACSICGDLFDIEGEGGTAGFIDLIPANFCPTCLSGVMEMLIGSDGGEC